MTTAEFKKQISEGIPSALPSPKTYDQNINHAPRRKDVLNNAEKRLAVKNALRYFPVEFHPVLAREFALELSSYGRIYMYRFMPDYEIKARHIDDFPYRTRSAGAIMLMISNNLDLSVAQHPHELITYGGQWFSLSKLGPVQTDDEISLGDDRRTDTCNLLWPSAWSVPLICKRAPDLLLLTEW